MWQTDAARPLWSIQRHRHSCRNFIYRVLLLVMAVHLTCTDNACENRLGEPKRLANISKHGLDFAALTEDFFADVFATLGLEGISVISMRPASKTEKRLYNEHFKDSSFKTRVHQGRP